MCIRDSYNDNSFNAAIRDEFVKQSKVNGNQVDVVDLYKEKFDPVLLVKNQIKKF